MSDLMKAFKYLRYISILEQIVEKMGELKTGGETTFVIKSAVGKDYYELDVDLKKLK